MDGIDRFRDATGLPIAPYFSASKILWLLENVPGLREDAAKGEAVFGTIDTWLIYKLTGACLGALGRVRRRRWMDGWIPSLAPALPSPSLLPCILQAGRSTSRT